MSTRPHALVTGGARRVGREIALELARAGCDVTITYAQNKADADATCRDLAAIGAHAVAIQLHLGDPTEVEDWANRIAGDFAHLDVLVHNASVYGPSPIETMTGERALHDFRVNALGPLILSGRLAPLLARSRLPGGGAIVAMLDMHVLGRPRRGFSSYAMSKAALAEMVRSLARELGPGVRVNGIAPGVVEWPEQGEESTEPGQRAYLARVPLGRAGTSQDAAKAVRWLAMEATYVTGEIVRVDGGRWLA